MPAAEGRRGGFASWSARLRGGWSLLRNLARFGPPAHAFAGETPASQAQTGDLETHLKEK